MKKLFSVLLSLCICAMLLPAGALAIEANVEGSGVFIGDTKLVSGKYYTVTGPTEDSSILTESDSAAGNYARYNSSTNTLTLMNFKYKYSCEGTENDGSVHYAAIKAYNDLNLVLYGSNSVSFRFKNGSGNDYGCGIYASEKLTVTGGDKQTSVNSQLCPLTATGPHYGVYAQNYLTVDNCSLKGVSGDSASAIVTGIYSNSIEVKGGNLEGTGGSSTDASSYGISATSLAVSGGSTVTGIGGSSTEHTSCGICGNALTVTDSTVTGTGGTSTNEGSYGIAINMSFDGRLPSIVIQDGSTVTATGGKAAEFSFGMNTDTIEIMGGSTVTATGGEAENSRGLYAAEVEIRRGIVTATGGNGSNNNFDMSYGIYASETATFTGGTVTATAFMSMGQPLSPAVLSQPPAARRTKTASVFL